MDRSAKLLLAGVLLVIGVVAVLLFTKLNTIENSVDGVARDVDVLLVTPTLEPTASPSASPSPTRALFRRVVSPTTVPTKAQ